MHGCVTQGFGKGSEGIFIGDVDVGEVYVFRRCRGAGEGGYVEGVDGGVRLGGEVRGEGEAETGGCACYDYYFFLSHLFCIFGGVVHC